MSLFRSASAWGLICLWALFIPMAYLLERQALFEVMDGIIISLGAGIVFSYGPATLQRLSVPLREHETADLLIIGVFTGALGAGLSFGLLGAWRLAGQPDDYIINWTVTAFPRWILVTSGAMLLTASNAIQGRVPPRSYLKTGVYIAAGVGLALAAIGYAVRSESIPSGLMDWQSHHKGP